MKILLVEDHAAVAQMSCSLLREVHGHDARHAASGADALTALAEFQPEIVLVDLNLPDMSGYDLASAIRARPEFAGILLVALTGWGNLIESQRASSAGFDAKFRKPMDFAILESLVEQLHAPGELPPH